MLESINTQSIGILPIFASRASARWCWPAPPGLAIELALNDSLLLRVPTDRLRRNCWSPTNPW